MYPIFLFTSYDSILFLAKNNISECFEGVLKKYSLPKLRRGFSIFLDPEESRVFLFF